MMHSQADSDAFKADWEARGAKVLMGGRIGETIEFYYLDTEPMLKFVLESGSGHAIDLTPSRTYPPS
jgi:methylmalonyl-CoA/ethylmalonyl-CoA epimerase